VQDGEVRALSRNGNDVTRSNPELAELGHRRAHTSRYQYQFDLAA
jgi:hypothetical protein